MTESTSGLHPRSVGICIRTGRRKNKGRRKVEEKLSFRPRFQEGKGRRGEIWREKVEVDLAFWKKGRKKQGF